ncbi:MAG: hypothetical protein ACJAXW_004474 [Candidatus Azotimanducaceae bacterium]
MIAAPIIIDLEASGFGAWSYPIEVGVVMQDGGAFCSLIMPASDWTHWDDEAECIHHLSRRALETFGQSPRAVAEELNTLLDGKTAYSDGWVVDRPWLTKLFSRSRLEMSFRVSPIELILSEGQIACWDETKQSVIADLGLQRHRASFDAVVIQETYRRTRQGALRQ